MNTVEEPAAETSGGETVSRVQVIFFSITALLALAGLADATYLTVAHLAGDTSICGPSAGCSTVLGSRYAAVGSIPTATFGAVAYFAVFSAALLAAFGFPRARAFLATGVTLMLLATLWFLYLQAYVLHAFCPFCLLSAAVTFMLAGLVLATPRPPS